MPDHANPEKRQAAELFQAIEAGDLGEVDRLVGDSPELAGARSTDGVSALLASRYRGRQDITDVLLAARPELDIFDAAALGDVGRIVALITENRSLASAWSKDGYTPLQLASFFGQPAAVKVLLANQADVRPASRNDMHVHALNAAAAGGHAAVVNVLLDAGADPDAPQQNGWTALMSAAANGDVAIAKLLLDAGADPSKATDDGTDAASLAIEKEHEAVLKLLGAAGS